ncbi:hypothetical protein Vadar_033114 [Vaccinium darrowii]|uniref:Uncharacterized protein n=1 Tax=Vaccinium darrowii TaxID=229202 RepID=A0ACB7Y4S1_9ERIC|nr:hypothetical protein Vadar_033114 [Vaccinium darrowii]
MKAAAAESDKDERRSDTEQKIGDKPNRDPRMKTVEVIKERGGGNGRRGRQLNDDGGRETDGDGRLKRRPRVLVTFSLSLVCNVFMNIKPVTKKDIYFSQFLKVSKGSHLRTGLVAERALSSPNMLYCSDITQLSLNEYPLVHYARECKLSGWFTICLQSIYTGNDIYVLEFFLSARSKDDNLLSTLSFILGTIEEKFKTFRLASGKKLGELMCVEVIYFQNEQKVDYVKPIQATRNFSTLSDLPSVQSSASVANKRPRFQGADMVTIKEKYDLNYDMFSDSDPSFDQSSASVANARPRFQDMVTIKAKYASTVMVLKLSLRCRLVELQQEVAKRLKLEAGTYHVVYKDEEDEFVLIACDEDLQVDVDASISQGNPSAVVLLKPKEPATNLNPTN